MLDLTKELETIETPPRPVELIGRLPTEHAGIVVRLNGELWLVDLDGILWGFQCSRGEGPFSIRNRPAPKREVWALVFDEAWALVFDNETDALFAQRKLNQRPNDVTCKKDTLPQSEDE